MDTDCNHFHAITAGFNLRYVQSLPCFSLCMFNEAERSSIVYRDKRSASPSKRKRKKKRKKGGEKKKVALQVKEPSCLEVNEVACLSRLYDLLSRQPLPKYLCLIPGNFELSILSKLDLNRSVTRCSFANFLDRFRLTFQFVQPTRIEYYVFIPTYNSLLLEKYYVGIATYPTNLSLSLPLSLDIISKNCLHFREKYTQ